MNARSPHQRGEPLDGPGQTVMATVFRPAALTKMQPDRGRFCHYLATALRNQWRKQVRHDQRECSDARMTQTRDDELAG